MKTIRALVLTSMALAIIFSAGSLYAEKSAPDEEGDRLFQVLDKDKDGKISKDEWDAMDVNQDGKVAPKEWKRFKFKSSRTVSWIDTNSDGHMDKREFRENFKK